MCPGLYLTTPSRTYFEQQKPPRFGRVCARYQEMYSTCTAVAASHGQALPAPPVTAAPRTCWGRASHRPLPAARLDLGHTGPSEISDRDPAPASNPRLAPRRPRPRPPREPLPLPARTPLPEPRGRAARGVEPAPGPGGASGMGPRGRALRSEGAPVDLEQSPQAGVTAACQAEPPPLCTACPARPRGCRFERRRRAPLRLPGQG